MTNWLRNKQQTMQKTANAVYAELECLTSEDTTANYWIDSTHNVFAFVNDNGDDDRWIEIHLELYSTNGDMIGDIMISDTDDIDKEELRKCIDNIVKEYFHE